MSLLTLKDVAQGPASRVSGLVPFTSPNVVGQQFTNYVNDATRQLMSRASWWSTVQPMEGCIRERCITWPRSVASVLAVNVNGRPVDLRNFWYRYLKYDMSYGHQEFWNWGGPFRQGGNFTRVMEMDGTIPVFNPIICTTGMFLLFYVSDASDIGKTITIYGVDGNGQMIRTSRKDGTVQDGVQITLGLPFTSTPFMIRRVDRVVKDVTRFPIRGYQWDGQALNPDKTPLVLDLAYYEAGETSPEYIHSRFDRFCTSGQCGTQQNICNTKITALVKLAFIPAVFPNDLVIIENQDALRDMIISIRKKEAGDIVSSAAYERSAIRELNFETQQRWPWEQTSVSFRPFGNDSFSRVMRAVNRG